MTYGGTVPDDHGLVLRLRQRGHRGVAHHGADVLDHGHVVERRSAPTRARASGAVDANYAITYVGGSVQVDAGHRCRSRPPRRSTATATRCPAITACVLGLRRRRHRRPRSPRRRRARPRPRRRAPWAATRPRARVRSTPTTPSATSTARCQVGPGAARGHRLVGVDHLRRARRRSSTRRTRASSTVTTRSLAHHRADVHHRGHLGEPGGQPTSSTARGRWTRTTASATSTGRCRSARPRSRSRPRRGRWSTPARCRRSRPAWTDSRTARTAIGARIAGLTCTTTATSRQPGGQLPDVVFGRGRRQLHASPT